MPVVADLLRDLAVGLGLWICIEGILVAAMPVRARRIAEWFLAEMERAGPRTVRLVALLVALAGVCIVWLVRG